MFEDVRKNKMKSIFIIFGFILMITLIVYYISIAFDLYAPVALTIGREPKRIAINCDKPQGSNFDGIKKKSLPA